jgi:hypothetical protein
VGRQYTGSAGKITNCQIGVFAAYVSDHGHALIDRQLYLPKAWTGDLARMRAAHVPEGIGFSTKPQLKSVGLTRLENRMLGSLVSMRADWALRSGRCSVPRPQSEKIMRACHLRALTKRGQAGDVEDLQSGSAEASAS